MKRILYQLDLRIIWCYYCRGQSKWNKPNIAAPFWRFYWNDRGGNYMYLDNREYELLPDTCFVIPPETPLAIASRNPVNHFYIHFTLGPPYHHPTPAIYPLRPDAWLMENLHQVIEWLSEEDADGEERLPLTVSAIVLSAISHIPAIATSSDNPEPRLRKTLALIERGNNCISNKELASEVHMHTQAFNRWFRQSTGQSPQAYMIRKRVERACNLLIYTSHTIERIAEETGFCDRHHFEKTFKKYRGVTPVVFRRDIIRR
jgi:AraC-like DNA-binding protein